MTTPTEEFDLHSAENIARRTEYEAYLREIGVDVQDARPRSAAYILGRRCRESGRPMSHMFEADHEVAGAWRFGWAERDQELSDADRDELRGSPDCDACQTGGTCRVCADLAWKAGVEDDFVALDVVDGLERRLAALVAAGNAFVNLIDEEQMKSTSGMTTRETLHRLRMECFGAVTDFRQALHAATEGPEASVALQRWAYASAATRWEPSAGWKISRLDCGAAPPDEFRLMRIGANGWRFVDDFPTLAEAWAKYEELDAQKP